MPRETLTGSTRNYLGPEPTPRDHTDSIIDSLLIHGLASELTVEGQEYIPQSGPCVVGFAPHSGSVDANALRYALRNAGLPPFDIMTKIENMKAIPGAIRGPRTFSVDRGGSVDTGAIGYAKSILKQGGIVASAFEGTRGRGTIEDLITLKKARKGLPLLALNTQAPILPVVVLGPERILPIPEEIIKAKGKAGFVLEVVQLMLQKKSKKFPLYVAITEPYTDHLSDLQQHLDLDDLLQAAQFHAHAIMITRIIPAILRVNPNHPLGYYQGKILDPTTRRLLTVNP